MSGSMGKSESQAQEGAKFDQNVWKPQGNALQNLYGQMGGLFGSTNQQMQGQIPGAIDQQQQIFQGSMAPWQQQMQGGAFAGMDTQGNYQNALQGGGNEQFINQSIMGGAGNNYVDAMKQQMQSDAFGNLGQGLATLDQRASQAGQPGSSRHGLAQRGMFDDTMDRLSSDQTNLGFQTFDKDLDRKMGIAQRADQFDMGRLNSTGNMLQAQQGAMAGGIQQGQGMQNLGMGQFAPSMAPWGAAGQYASSIGRPTVLGSGQSSGSSDSKGKASSGGIGG